MPPPVKTGQPSPSNEGRYTVLSKRVFAHGGYQGIITDDTGNEVHWTCIFYGPGAKSKALKDALEWACEAQGKTHCPGMQP